MEQQSKRAAVAGNMIGRKNVPDLTFDLQLNQINLTLVNNIEEFKGVTLEARNFKVSLKNYDGTNKYNAYTTQLDVVLPTYGLNVVHKDPQTAEISSSPFL